MSFGVLSDPTTKTEKITFMEERPLIGLFGTTTEHKLASLGIILFKVECDDSGLETVAADSSMDSDL